MSQNATPDVVLVGAGIMGATPPVGRLDGTAADSGDPWNNTGTGHSARPGAV